MPDPVQVIGGGLAGAEAAWQLARRGVPVRLFEMRPVRSSPAHTTGDLAELVCSNSLRSAEPHSAVGLLKEEMRRLGSLIMAAAGAARVPAGKALAVDRHDFARHVTRELEDNPLVEIRREEVEELPGDLPDRLLLVEASGPEIRLGTPLSANEPLVEHDAERSGNRRPCYRPVVADALPYLPQGAGAQFPQHLEDLQFRLCRRWCRFPGH